ncbi:MAG TPA: MFS transporter [Ktedonobacterales bacterium]|jgi:MFS family permease
MFSTTQDSAESAAVPAPQKPGLLINRNFARLWAGQSLSAFGDMIFDTTLLVWVAVLTKGQSWSPLAISGLLIAAAVPNLLVGPMAGVFVDRWDKRRTMLCMDAARALLVGGLVLATNVVPLPFLPQGRLPLSAQLGATFAVIFLASICAQFFNPSRFALLGDIVEDEHRPRAIGLSQTTQGIAGLIAPAAAPPLYLIAGAQWALVLNALSFVASFFLILSLRLPETARTPPSEQPANFWREFREGLSFAVGNRTISTLFLSLLIILFGVSVWNGLDILFALQRLRVPLNLYGVLSASFGLGTMGGALLAGAYAKRIGLARLFTLCFFIFSLLFVTYSRLTNFAFAFPVIFIAGVLFAGVNVSFGPLLLRVTPREILGRISALVSPIQALVSLLGTALAGYLAGTLLQGFHASVLGFSFSPIDTIFTGGGLLALGGAVFATLRLGFTDPAPVTASPSAASLPAHEPAQASREEG